MKVKNLHSRRLAASMAEAGVLIDGLAGPDDRLWPKDRWPAMAFDRGLTVGARGGHGPIRYRVREYSPGERIVFDFEEEGLAGGLKGGHWFGLRPEGDGVVLTHVIEADCGLGMWLRWQVIIRPLHDALVEDALDNSEIQTGRPPSMPARWSFWVRTLRKALARGPKKG